MTDRAVLLADLADAINALTRPRRETEYVERVTARTTESRNGKIRKRRVRERVGHTVTFPPLLDELREAAVPGSNSDGPAVSGGFESRPSAELEPVAVLREIVTDATAWARTFRLSTVSLPRLLSSLVSAQHDDEQLTTLTAQAERWVLRAKQATGHEAAPVTLNHPCPMCGRRSALVISGDLTTAKCSRCQTRWTVDNIGLLAEMLRANEQQETMTQTRCYWRTCTRVGPHDEHLDQDSGRTWRDYCDVPIAVGE